MNHNGLDSKDMRLFLDLLIGANDEQLLVMHAHIGGEIDRRIAQHKLQEAHHEELRR